jgi:hypothetical protein
VRTSRSRQAVTATSPASETKIDAPVGRTIRLILSYALCVEATAEFAESKISKPGPMRVIDLILIPNPISYFSKNSPCPPLAHGS